jgi:probable O-glycosylation ligase (exosortase A-associated)
MLVPLFAALAETTDRLWPRRLYRFLLVGVLYRAITTYSRAGFLGATALASLWGLRSPHKLRALTGMALIAAIIAPVLPGAFWDRMGTISNATEVGDVSALGRLHFWDVARAMADAHPVVGVGFNAYNAAYDDYDFSRGQYGSARSVHSAWFGVLAELGYVGLALYLAIVLLALRNCWQTSRSQGSESLKELKLYSTSLAVSLAVFAVGASFGPSQYSEMAWHCIGLTVAIRRLAIEQVPPASTNAEEGDYLPEDDYSSISAENPAYGLPF